MYNLKFSLIAQPTEIKTKWTIGIYGKSEQILANNSGETPRGERLCEKIVSEVINDSNNMVENAKTTIFRGFDTDIPQNSFNIMETNIKLKFNKHTKFVKVSKGDFQRYNFEGKFTSAISILQHYTNYIYNVIKDFEKIFVNISEEEYDCKNEAILDSTDLIPLIKNMINSDGHVDKDKIMDLIKP